jgi:hypothetical protein
MMSLSMHQTNTYINKIDLNNNNNNSNNNNNKMIDGLVDWLMDFIFSINWKV